MAHRAHHSHHTVCILRTQRTITALINMKFAGILLMVGAVAAGRLEHTYLPPGSAGSAGGAAFVQAPGFGAGHGGSSAGYNTGSYQGNQGGYRGEQIAITRYDNQNNGDGQYQYSYETANGISAEESGALQGNGQAVKGSYSYTGPDGLQYTVHYTADENGFHPEGAHLPTPPPVPEAIRRGVELSLAAEARGENQNGQYRPEPQKNYYNQYQGGAAATANAGYHY